jgi:hypothetical protein
VNRFVIAALNTISRTAITVKKPIAVTPLSY